MKSFFKIKSVGSGMAHLLDEFCKLHKIHTSESQNDKLNEHLPFDIWLKKIKKIKKQCKREGLGLEIGALARPHHIGIVAYIANSCDFLSHYINLIPKYEKLWFNYMPKTIQIEEDNFSILWSKPAYLQSGLYVQETTISEEIQISILYHQLLKLTNTNKYIFKRIELAIPKPKNLIKYENFFNCPIKFDTEKTKIVLPKSLLNTKLKNSDPILLEILCNQADLFLHDIPQEDDFLELVHVHVIKAIENNSAHIHYIAETLNTPPRMLQKDLKKRGSSFQMILNEIRINLAKKYLMNKSISITEIAFSLAYKDQTSFNRAFKSWTGVAPSTWRKKNISDQ